MPFGLKNVGTTYQCLMDKVFHGLLKNIMEVYVDDMVVKSTRAELRSTHLESFL